MKIRSQLVEFCSGSLLLQFSLLKRRFPGELFQLLSHLLILCLNVQQIALSGVEVMLVFPAVKPSVVLLYDLGLFVEKFALFVLLFRLFLKHELTTANEPPPYLLDFLYRSSFVIEVPLHFEHPPTFLNYNRPGVFFITELLSFVYHVVVLVN